MARAVGLSGWHSMRKDELVQALISHAKKKGRRNGNGRSATDVLTADSKTNGKNARISRDQERLRQLRSQFTDSRQLGTSSEPESTFSN